MELKFVIREAYIYAPTEERHAPLVITDTCMAMSVDVEAAGTPGQAPRPGFPSTNAGQHSGVRYARHKYQVLGYKIERC